MVCVRLGQDASSVEYRRAMAAAEVIVGWPDPGLLAASPLELLLLPSAGYEEYLIPELAAKGSLAICNAGGAYSEGVAEHCVAMMLALARRLPEYLAAMRPRRWEHLHRHGRLAGSTVCVIGLGTLGSAIARRCAALGMRVVGVRRHPDRPAPAVSEVFGPEDLAAAVAGADHVVGALPGGAATRGLIGREVISAMKPGGCSTTLAGGRPSMRRPWWSGWPTGAWPERASTCSPPSHCPTTARCGRWRMSS